MVDALKEIWRVLTPTGKVIDLRPLATNAPLEVVSGEEVLLAGRIDESQNLPSDLATHQALVQITQEGWFVCEREETFDYIAYWDRPEEIITYFEEKRNSLILPESVFAQTQRLLRRSSAGAKLRIPFKMVIARYRKQDASQSFGN